MHNSHPLPSGLPVTISELHAEYLAKKPNAERFYKVLENTGTSYKRIV